MKYQRFEKYKKTGLDWLEEIPEEWKIVRVKSQYEIMNGSTPSSTVPEYWDGDIPWATPADISSITKYIYDTKRKLTELGLNNCGAKLAKEGSVILTTRAPIGNVAVMGNQMCVNQGCKILVKNNDNQIEEYLFYYLSSFNKLLNIYGSGSTFLELSTSALASFILVNPPINSQRLIVRYLDLEITRIDSLIEEKENLIKLLKEKRETLIAHVVTKGLNPETKMKDSGIDYIGEIPKDWDTRRLKSVLRSPLSYGANEIAEDKNEYDPRFIRITDIDENGDLIEDKYASIQLEKAIPYLLVDGDILFARSGATVGKVFRYKSSYGPAAYAGYLIRAQVNMDLCLPSYFHYITKAVFFPQWIQSILIQSTIQNVSAEKYNNFYFPLPNLQIQKIIVEYLDHKVNLNKEIENEIKRSITLLKELRESLISEVVTGKIKVTEEMIYDSQKT
jgi:restriction endonuclease S subunit